VDILKIHDLSKPKLQQMTTSVEYISIVTYSIDLHLIVNTNDIPALNESQLHLLWHPSRVAYFVDIILYNNDHCCLCVTNIAKLRHSTVT
jgi:hypothetical protein